MGRDYAFERFFRSSEPSVRRALVARFGGEVGREAVAEGFAVAWRMWESVSVMDNAAGYVYRTSERWAIRQVSRSDAPSVVIRSGGDRYEDVEDRYEDVELAEALRELSPRQRQAVVLVSGFGMTHREAADLLGCSKSSIQSHVERALERLRSGLEVHDDA